jgi:hypothetical protein
VTDDSPVNLLSQFSQGEDILNRMNSRSVLESFYRMNADVDGVELDDVDQNVFDRNFLAKGGKVNSVMPPNVSLKKTKVSIQTLNLMKKRLLQKSDSRSKWVPNGHQKQSKVFN